MSVDSRRSFIQKLIAGTAGAFVFSKAGIAKKAIELKEEKTIKQIKPLGFQWETSDPFLFCVHHEDFFPKGNDKMGPNASLEGRQIGQDFVIKDGWRMYHGSEVPGFPGHPHRGFETITVVKKGIVDHTDSLGASGRYGNGDVQWMTAGKGVQHAEMFPLLSKTKENPMELFQIWLNLPKKDKFVEPHFKMLWSETIPTHNHKDENGNKTNVEVIIGNLYGDKAPTPPPNSWAFNADNQVAIWNIEMEPHAIWKVPIASKEINRTIYYFEGNGLQIDDTEIDHYHAAEVLANRKITLKNGAEKASILVLQGKPIGEPVVQHGPMVMNTKAEIKQAFDDYQKTKFGGWPWKSYAQVHDRNKGRFAIHANGKEEIKS
ncbi:pirin family protein [Vicingaceae bacterium]|nr:pirin family protein [Vicingaceae bacterium]